MIWLIITGYNDAVIVRPKLYSIAWHPMCSPPGRVKKIMYLLGKSSASGASVLMIRGARGEVGRCVYNDTRGLLHMGSFSPSVCCSALPQAVACAMELAGLLEHERGHSDELLREGGPCSHSCFVV
jgi:hypothetical protein